MPEILLTSFVAMDGMDVDEKSPARKLFLDFATESPISNAVNAVSSGVSLPPPFSLDRPRSPTQRTLFSSQRNHPIKARLSMLFKILILLGGH